MTPTNNSPLAAVKALTFDVFGTTVDWRASVVNELQRNIQDKLSGSISAELRERLKQLNEQDTGASEPWTTHFANTWRDSYVDFGHQQARAGQLDSANFKTTDQHFYDSLVELLGEWDLAGLFSAYELKSISLVWHRLVPWPDTVAGLAKLAAPPLGLVTVTLTNGNTDLIRNLNEFGQLGFQHLFCAEMLHAYKPAPDTYLGAAQKLGLQPGEVAMVAAHMSDLAAARNVGLRTVYVEREDEEWWDADDERLAQAREWVDVWISKDEDGFLELAKQLTKLQGQ
ncbi:hypothetical protein VHEMI04214 [[Torrubiella] hemipterigena]|uniref:Haloacid dehalogenase n=1 Tax=[Torrubiella] hemipterigena TaxID=1531966 RepID=A0A0A1TFS2_9HYPO|nr:hypothetical protein VHEMI04214 [[Torrubiella] hemipterigena]